MTVLEILWQVLEKNPLLWVLLPTAFLAFLLPGGKRKRSRKGKRSSKEIGDEGEARVNAELERIGLRHLHDAYLSRGRGTTQIDQIVNAGRAIVVIECKAMYGTIYADTRSRLWTKYLANEKTTFQNPLLQNVGHVEAVAQVAGSVPVVGLIVMAGNATFKKGRPEGVVTLKEMKAFFERYSGYDTRVEKAWDRLSAAVRSNDNAASRYSHRETVRRRTGKSF